MKKLKLLCISLLCACMIIGVIPSANVQAADDGTAIIVSQYLSSRVCEKGNVFYDAIAFDIGNIHKSLCLIAWALIFCSFAKFTCSYMKNYILGG